MLAGPQGRVTRRFEVLAQGHAVFQRSAGIFEIAVLLGVKSRQQARPRRIAFRRVVELGETNALTGQFVEVRSLHLAAVTADVGPAQVVGRNKQYVRERLLGPGTFGGFLGRGGVPPYGGGEKQRQTGKTGFVHRRFGFGSCLFFGGGKRPHLAFEARIALPNLGVNAHARITGFGEPHLQP